MLARGPPPRASWDRPRGFRRVRACTARWAGVSFLKMEALLDRDVELGELGRRLAEARAGSGRVIVVDGPGRHRQVDPARAPRAGPPRADGAVVLRARCSPLEQHAAWGMARQLFDPLRARPDWDELTAGAAGLAGRVLAPEAGEPAHAGDAMHAAVRGLVWLASNLGERGPAVFAVDDVHWADAPSLRWLALLARSLGELPIGVLCAVRSGEPAAAPELLAELLASAPEPPVRPRALGPAAVQTLVRERLPAATRRVRPGLPRRDRRQPVPARCPADPARRRRRRTGRRGRRAAGDVRVRAGRARHRAPARPAARRGRAAGPRRGRPRPRRAAAPCRPAGPARAGRRGPRRGRAAGRRAARGRAGADARAPADRRNAVREPARRASGPCGTPHAAALLAGERADPERIGLHLLRTEPAREAATVADPARGGPAGPARAALRRARRPTCAARPPNRRRTPAQDADVRLELGLALAAYLQPDAYDLLHEAVDVAATARPARRDRPARRPCPGPDRAFRRGRRAVPSSARAGRRVPRGTARAARGRAGTQRPGARLDGRGGAALRARAPARIVGAGAVAGVRGGLGGHAR